MGFATEAINGFNSFNFSGFLLGAGSVSCPISVPQGQFVTAGGHRPIQITQINPFFSGRNASIPASVTLGSGTTGTFTLPSGGTTPEQRGPFGISAFFADGGEPTLTLNGNGAFNYGHQQPVSGIDISGSNPASNTSLTGYFGYCSAPSAPGKPVITVGSGGGCTVRWAAPADNGGSVITKYFLQYSTSPAFTSPTQITLGNVLSANLTLTPGQVYYFRVSAANAVSLFVGNGSAFGPVASATMGTSGPKIKDPTGVWRPGRWVVKKNGLWVPVSFRQKVSGVWKPLK